MTGCCHLSERRVGMHGALLWGRWSVKNLQVRISRQTSTADIAASACYRPDGLQECDVDEATFRQLEEASHSQALVLVKDGIHLSIFLKNNTTIQEIPGAHWQQCPTCKSNLWGTLLDLIFKNMKGLSGNVKISGIQPWLHWSWDGGVHDRRRTGTKSRITTLDSMRRLQSLWESAWKNPIRDP